MKRLAFLACAFSILATLLAWAGTTLWPGAVPFGAEDLLLVAGGTFVGSGALLWLLRLTVDWDWLQE